MRLPAYDGEDLYLEVVRPAGPGPYPVVLESSPYHGTLADRDGTRILPEPLDDEGRPLGLTGYFAPRGYAVVMMDLRGTGRSEGCLDHLGPKDARDLEQVVEWAASRSWSNGRVGNDRGTPTSDRRRRWPPPSAPTGLATIVPSAGLASMYDHQFQAGVPYFLQWAGPIEAYEQIALERKLPGGDDFGNNLEDTGCGLPNSAAIAGEDQLSGRYSDWHSAARLEEGVTDADIPVFLVHGVNDNAARVPSMEWFTRARRPGVATSCGWPVGPRHRGAAPTRRGIQWTYALQAWFDRHVPQRKVDTGPPVELLHVRRHVRGGPRTGDRDGGPDHDRVARPVGPGEVLPRRGRGAGTRRPRPARLTLHRDNPGLRRPEQTGGATFRSAADVGPRVRRPAEAAAVGVGDLTAGPSDRERVRRGRRRHWRRISQCTINPELRGGLATSELVSPASATTCVRRASRWCTTCARATG